MSRDKSVLHASVVGVAARVLNAFSGLITIPITINYLGSDVYGIWLAIIGFGSLISIADFGIGHCLANDCSRDPSAQNDLNDKDKIAAGFLILYASGFILMLAGLVVFFYPSLVGFVFSGDPAQAIEAGCAFGVLMIVVGAGIAMSPFTAVARGALKVQVINYGTIFGIVISLGLLIAAVRMQAPLPVLTACFMLHGPISRLICVFYAKYRFHTSLLPDLNSRVLAHLPLSFKRGFKFQGLQFLAIGNQTIPIILINRLIGGTTAAEFGIALRVMGFLTTVLGSLGIPLWSAFKNAADSSDQNWISRSIKTYSIVIFALAIAYVLVITLTVPLWQDLWLNNTVEVSRMVVFAIGLLTAVMVTATPLVMLLNASENLYVQYKCGLATLFSSSILILLIQTYGLGAYAVSYALINSILFIIIFLPDLRKNLQKGSI